MIKLNSLQYQVLEDSFKLNDFSLDALVGNDNVDALYTEYKKMFGFKKLKTFAFSKEGFLGLFLELKGKIAISLGESLALIEAGKLYESLGFEVLWLDLKKDGKVNLSTLEKNNIDFLFLSSYVMDTFVKTDLEEAKGITSAKIISNASANFDSKSDIIYFDLYKLAGFSLSSVLLFNNEEFELLPLGSLDTIAVKLCIDSLKSQEFNHQMKGIFLEKLKEVFKEDIYFFVKPEDTFDFSLHFALKGIKAREFIRTLALNKIFLTNGEGCSLGLSKPSRIIQAMGYDETTSRNAINLSFTEEIELSEIDKLVNLMYLKYKQIRMLS
ncbi:cysteine desulfurase [Halarcobacter ebronensis]|uniref:Cysteine desulfurase n=1 Tax=Halarcobacter ebronensis TaxID=1462615 RepID=A0A4Q1AGJ2_9BACT|nr:cysteine desulfurase [Halarcobacter ebronensis]QKF81811.1 NifS/IscS family cysteine desulfurase [Halarcobacter ebronensis]RXK00701.1 cysteine desulfurase [Halarcobacter ebronensis]